MRSVASTDIGSSVGMRFSPKISVLGDFAPLEGFIYAFGTAFSVSVILGLVILSLNMIVNHNSGIVVSGGLIFFYMFSKMLGGYVFNYFSPLIWCSLTIADKHGISALPDVPWIIAVLCILFAAENAVLYIFGSKKIKFDLDNKEDIV